MCDYCEDDTGTRPPYIEDVALRIPQLEITKDEEGMLGATVVSVADRPDDLENDGVFTICPGIAEDTGEYCGLTAQLKMVSQNDQDGGGAPCIFDSKIAAMKWVEYSLQTHDQDRIV